MLNILAGPQLFTLHLVWINCWLIHKVGELRPAAWNINKIANTQFSDIAQEQKKAIYKQNILPQRSENQFWGKVQRGKKMIIFTEYYSKHLKNFDSYVENDISQV